MKLDSWRFDKWLEREDPFTRSDARLDISYVDFITPIGLVSLAATCYAVAIKGKHPTIVIGNNYDLFAYLERAGFVATVENIAEFEPKVVKKPTRDKYASIERLVELTRLETGTPGEIAELLEMVLSHKVESVLKRRFGYDNKDAKDIAVAISEVCQNTFDHNKANSTCAFVAMQVYGGNFFEIGIADYGDGIAKTLKRSPKNYEISSHLDAILLSTEHGVSEYDEAGRGSGLTYLFEKAKKHKGTLQIRSGDTAVRYRMDKGERRRFSGVWMPGVQISFMLGSKKTS